MGDDFDIHSFKEKLAQLLVALESKPYFQPYVVPLRNYIVRKIFVGISQAYETIKFDELLSLVTLPGPFELSPLQIEKALMQAAMDDYVTFTIDHETNTITFGKDPFESLTAAGTTTATAEDIEENDEIEEGSKTDGEELEAEPVVTRNSAIRAHLNDLAKLASKRS